MMLKTPMIAALAISLMASAHADGPYDTERRLNTVTVTTLPPDKGALHINPVIRRPQDFQRPGFSEMELVFVPVALLESGLKPMLGEENRDYLRLITELPERLEGIPFEDTPKSYFTQTVILPRGYYVLSEVTFRQTSAIGGPDIRTVSHCQSDQSFLLHVKGRDVMFMGRPEIEYPTEDRLAEPSFNPAAKLVDHIDDIRGWRWTTTDLTELTLAPAQFERTEAFCSPQAISPAA